MLQGFNLSKYAISVFDMTTYVLKELENFIKENHISLLQNALGRDEKDRRVTVDNVWEVGDSKW